MGRAYNKVLLSDKFSVVNLHHFCGHFTHIPFHILRGIGSLAMSANAPDYRTLYTQ